MAGRILGMGDVLTLVEQMQDKVDVETLHATSLQADFNFETFITAQNMMSKIGNFSGVFNMMGMGNLMNQAGININKETQEKMLSESEVKMKKFKSAIQSMTKEEKIKPDLLNSSRKRRVSKGAGLKEYDLDKLVKEFNQMKKLMDQFKPLMGGFQMPGAKQQSLSKPQSNLLKGFKPKKQK